MSNTSYIRNPGTPFPCFQERDACPCPHPESIQGLHCAQVTCIWRCPSAGCCLASIIPAGRGATAKFFHG